MVLEMFKKNHTEHNTYTLLRGTKEKKTANDTDGTFMEHGPLHIGTLSVLIWLHTGILIAAIFR